MLTSSANQYLRPEYLTPLATTLDAKKSPLALLAQTCSQIGADPPSNKSSLLAPLEKSSATGNGGLNKTVSKSSSSSSLDQHHQQQRDKSSPSSNLHQQQPSSSLSIEALSTAQVRSSFKPYESCLGREKASSPEDQQQQQQQQQQRAPSNNSSSGTRARTPGSGKRCSSNQSASSTRAATPQGRRTATPNGEPGSITGSRESPRSNSRNSPTTSLVQGKPPASAYSPGSVVLGMTDPGVKDLPLGTFKPGNHVPVSTSSGYLTYAPQLPIDVMASSLMSQHHAALKNGLGGNPYLGYARMKTASGAETLVPVCRDPYCTGCQLNSQLLANSSSQSKIPTSTGPCPAGCAQCDHKPPPPSSASPYGHLGAHSPVAAAYAHAQLAALAAASQLPYVCNWISGDAAYCGKRFSTSEELLQHLRSHTSVNSGDPSAAAAALSLLSPPGLPPNHPLLSRTYPTPPLSPLATARYHPYGKPSPLMTHSLSSLGLPMPPHPHHPAGLPPYFSPYSLYAGPRLGAASGMHP